MLGIKFNKKTVLNTLKLSAAALILSILSGCSQERDASTLVVATLAGPESQLVETAATVAHSRGINVKIVTFEDYSLPNAALADGSVDINVFQHEPFLKKAMTNTGFDLSILGRTFIFPMGIYSKTIKTLSELPDEALVAIPSDPSNGERALLLLESAGLIKLNPDVASKTINDITENPKHLKLQEMDAAFLPRALDDVSLAVINTTFALPSGLTLESALFKEDAHSPYANLIVCRTQDKDKDHYLAFVEAMHSEAVIDKAAELFGSSAVPAW